MKNGLGISLEIFGILQKHNPGEAKESFAMLLKLQNLDSMVLPKF